MLEQATSETRWRQDGALATLSASARATPWLLTHWFSLYRWLFIGALGVNALVLTSPQLRSVALSFGADTPATANMFLAVLLRNELFIRLLHKVLIGACNPAVVPLAVRLRITAFLLYMGGLHRGFAISAMLWLGSAVTWHTPIGATLLLLLAFVALLAIRPVREKWHNLFEYSHRYLGWTALIVLWVDLILKAAGSEPWSQDHLNRLLATASFWFALATSALIAAPWLTVRRVRVTTYAPSSNVIAIKFRGGLGVGAFGRISRHLLADWHTFALVSQASHSRSHVMVISALGDFTRELVRRPPKTLYVRSVKFLGLPYSLQLYRRAVIITTGAGIAPFLPLLMQAHAPNYHVVWVGRSLSETFGRRLSEVVLAWPYVTVWDTVQRGRPDLVALAMRAYREFQAEVIFVGCNPEATRQLVYGCKAMGVPAFGPSGDS